MGQDYAIEELVGFLQEIASRKATIELQLEMYGGDDPAILELREQLEDRLERLQEKEDRITERVDTLLAADTGEMPE